MSLSKMSDSDVEMLVELRRNERSLCDVTLPHYSNARLARFLFLLLNAKHTAADYNSNSSSDDISDMMSHSHALIDSNSPVQILK